MKASRFVALFKYGEARFSSFGSSGAAGARLSAEGSFFSNLLKALIAFLFTARTGSSKSNALRVVTNDNLILNGATMAGEDAIEKCAAANEPRIAASAPG